MTREEDSSILRRCDDIGVGLILQDIRTLIESTRAAVAESVNVSLTLLYWRIGERINSEVLGRQRGRYGEEIVSTLSRQLEADFGKGFAEKNLRHMMRFADEFPDGQIVASLSQWLSWSHFKELIYLKQPLQKEFYAEMCRVERWSVRTLRSKIGSMLFERTALSKQPETLARFELESLRSEDRMTPDLVFRDPYFLDFLGLKDTWQEKDLEAAILRELESFLMELGSGFTFVARQKRRWNSTFAGWTSMSAKPEKSLHSASSCAPAKMMSASSCLNWVELAFTWPSISPNSHPKSCCASGFMPLSNAPGNGWRIAEPNNNSDAYPQRPGRYLDVAELSATVLTTMPLLCEGIIQCDARPASKLPRLGVRAPGRVVCW